MNIYNIKKMQNKYEVLGVVGEGAYGIVYKCKNKETKEYVAIKKFKETEDDIVKKTMKRELKVLQIMKHENIVEFKEAFKRKNNLFLVFEYVERNLLELLQEKPTGLDPTLIRSIIYQLCKSVHYLHSQNIIHRDVKPENLLIDNNMKLKLCDFGFARKVMNNKKETLTDYVATRWYRSPELLITNGIYGIEVDYWAIGCIMGELTDGNPLFPGENESDQLHCIQKVLGNLPEDQKETYYKNPLFDGKSLLDVQKPETLRRRYMGKLPKVAIDFMKGLLELDPSKRLCSGCFNHPYFSCYKDDPSNPMANVKENSSNNQKPKSSNDTNNGNVSLTISSQPNISSTINSNTTIQINPLNSNTNTATVNIPNVNAVNSTIQPESPLINTTNINIINYNTFNNSDSLNTTQVNNCNPLYKKINNLHSNKAKQPSKEKGNILASMAMTMTNQFPLAYQNTFDKQKQNQFDLSSKKSYEAEIPSTTSLNFNANQSKGNLNITSLLPSSQLAYKTFYKNKNDKYNFGINTNFPNYSLKNNPICNNTNTIDEEVEYKATNTKKSKSLNHGNQKYNSKLSNNNINYYECSPKDKSKNIYEMIYSNKSNSPSKNPNMNNNIKQNNYYQSIYGAMPNVSCYGYGFAKDKNVYLPQLNKNHYQNNYKKFHQLVNR